ncbi:MAG TPA: A/G-specific adenine glycosylase [Geminicoccaceae bacterium]|nr:A/G-specific adenine glycosylase [Geminicoccaceae bacterium]
MVARPCRARGAGPAPAAALIARLLTWYDRHRRQLPWRAAPGRRAEPYHVLLSEIMLQQTTAATVSRRFGVFLARFPDLAALAAADEAEVLHAWQGLGYYRRARALHALARLVTLRHGGRLPRDQAALRALPGIGPYTASALRAIAFGQPAVPVDGNVLRVMARLHRVETPLPAALPELRERAQALAESGRPGDLAQALMDLGAMVCRPRQPRCGLCPWQASCAGHAAGIAAKLPRRRARAARPIRRGLAFLLRRPDGAMLFRQRPPDGLLGGLHELPSSPWQEGELVLEAALRHAPAAADWRLQKAPVRHAFTHFLLELTLAEASTTAANGAPSELWCRTGELDRLALPTVMRKLLRQAGALGPDGARAGVAPGR